MQSPSRLPDLWQPLQLSTQEIRLLVLHPASLLTDPIVCELETVALIQRPDYEALSYCWGDAEDLRSINISGQDHQITVNLHDALLGLRRADEARHIWVDAVCINQQDTKERNHQVSMMRAIYSEARVVRVWLSATPVHLAALKSDSLESVSNIAGLGRAHIENYEPLLASTGLMRLEWWTRVWTFQEIVLAQTATFHVGQREITLDTLRAYHEVTTTHLLRVRCCSKVFKQFPSSHAIFTPGHIVLGNMLQYRRQLAAGNIDLLDAIADNQDRSASDARDRLFAFVGLVSNIPEGFVDYGQATESSYKSCMRQHIRQTRNLELLRYAAEPYKEEGWSYAGEREKLRLPSWCPNWDYKFSSVETTAMAQQRTLGRHFNASHTALAQWSDVDDNSIAVRGVLFDAISELTDTKKSLDTVAMSQICGWATLLLKYLRRAGKTPSQDSIHSCQLGKATKRGFSARIVEPLPLETHNDSEQLPHDEAETPKYGQLGQLAFATYSFGSSETYQDAFRLTLSYGQGLETPVGPRGGNDSETCARLNKILSQAAFIRWWESVTSDQDCALVSDRIDAMLLAECMHKIKNVHSQRAYQFVSAGTARQRLAISAKGAIGLVPSRTKVDDVICIIYGCSMPCILRRCNDEPAGAPATWRLIGCAYIHGLMHGTFLESGKLGKTAVQDFRLV